MAVIFTVQSKNISHLLKKTPDLIYTQPDVILLLNFILMSSSGMEFWNRFFSTSVSDQAIKLDVYSC